MTTEDSAALDLTGAAWVKSSYSDAAQQCIEVTASFPGVVPVRDSKNPEGPALVFPQAAFAEFVNAAVAGEFGDA
ncbi:DUF397 domain-containing protein [Streptomyces sp. TRM68367]|uniref:DUF397 domain-containing protein n=1 Tax=Streptomyces sp. TRM68367 TaxID=2758415 RepID=UPI00165BC17D|nr:DUF397 domain-containing protein [Streptomyces sp. TRM68367]MBC9730238.1 DUF397 domain-containing protein [Streptomyces sp. TRM68367]